MRRTSTASGSLENENLKGHHEELYPHYHLVMSRHSIYNRTVKVKNDFTDLETQLATYNERSKVVMCVRYILRLATFDLNSSHFLYLAKSTESVNLLLRLGFFFSS